MSGARQKTCAYSQCDNEIPKGRHHYCGDDCYIANRAERSRIDHEGRTCHYADCDKPIPPPPQMYCGKVHAAAAFKENRAKRRQGPDPEIMWLELLDGKRYGHCEIAIEADRTGRAPQPQPAFVAREATS